MGFLDRREGFERSAAFRKAFGSRLRWPGYCSTGSRDKQRSAARGPRIGAEHDRPTMSRELGVAMLTPHRARHDRAGRASDEPGWLMLYGRQETTPAPSSIHALELVEEGRLPPRPRLRERLRAAEVLTYVREGALAFEDSTGRVGVVRAGEFQRMSLGPGNRHNEVNASSQHWAHAFQIWLGVGDHLRPGLERRRFSIAQRRGRLCTVASPDARDGSLLLQQDVVVYSAILGRGQHVVHLLAPERSAWLHVVEGIVEAGPSLMLTTGDGLSVTHEAKLSLTAYEASEILLVDAVGSLVGITEA